MLKQKLLLITGLLLPLSPFAATNTLLGWNNLGMHCMDSDYSVFSILPPYNTIEAQLIVGGKLVTNDTGYTVTFEAVADPDGSRNTTSRSKGNFYQFVSPLYGAALTVDSGLLSWPMPGTNNVPQAMLFEQTNHPAAGVATTVNWFRAEGIPITPYDDAGRKNPYPLMRIIARNASSQPIATNDIVLPVSDEMDCRTCHASGTQASAKPASGWVWSNNPERDFRLNILRLHDEHQFTNHTVLYKAALSARGFNPQGLYRGVVADGKPVLCASCHASEALGTGSYSNIPPLTASVHAYHAQVMDPDLHITLDNSSHRAACYRCHPGSATKCLRGAMGGAIATDGSMEMQCQSCHGSMSAVGASNRVGWFMEPNCQSCHTGTATRNNGKIRYTTCFETNGAVRVATNQTFATTPNTPAAGISLYRFSRGHGGLQCSACHGSTHAEFPSTHRNDNLRNAAIQGHAGVMIECTACHTTMAVNTNTATAGPHGMHPIGQNWVNGHADIVDKTGRAACQVCHGANYRGTVLSRAQANRSWNIKLDAYSGIVTFPRGAEVGCFTCHLGPDTKSPNTATPPSVTNTATNTFSGQPIVFTLPVSGAGITLRIISQPANGSVGLNNTLATYYPDQGFAGTDSFTFAAYDGTNNSGLATGTVTVAQGAFSLVAMTHAPTNSLAGWPATFIVIPTLSNITAAVSFDWDFGDGTLHVTNQYSNHVYPLPGTYQWQVVSSVSTVSTTNTGTIVITSPAEITVSLPTTNNTLSLALPAGVTDAVLEQADDLFGPAWTTSTNSQQTGSGAYSVSITNTVTKRFYRLRLVQ
jgi:hypothetical protein